MLQLPRQRAPWQSERNRGKTANWTVTIIWTSIAATALIVAVHLGTDGSVEAMAPVRQDDLSVHATATRVAELDQLVALESTVAALEATVAALQTEVAQPRPEATPTAEPTPMPPVPSGQALPYGDGWTVTAFDVTPRPTIGELTATGLYIEVRLEVTNTAASPRPFPYEDFVLQDGEGRTYVLAHDATTLLNAEVLLLVAPTLPKGLRLVYEVLPDAGQRFVLESTRHPTFRVQLIVAPRG